MNETWIYHEKQFSLLCGQHCLNNLLQGPYFDAPGLAQIGQELDAEERRVMLEAGADTPEALRFLAEDSGNVDETGNFSVQVLNTALEKSHGLTLLNTGRRELRDSIRDYTKEEGFVCNRSAHWFAIRRIGRYWWNLNSTLERPEHVGGFHLCAFLDQLRAEGYQVFVGRPAGAPPAAGPPAGAADRWPPPLPAKSAGDPAQWHREGYLLALPAGSGRDEVAADPWAALGEGRTLAGGGAPAVEAPAEADMAGLSEEEQLAIALSLSMQPRAGPAAAAAGGGGGAAFLEVPVPDEPPAGPDCVRIQVRFPSGKKAVRRFEKHASVAGLFAFVKQELMEQNHAAAGTPGGFEVVAAQGRAVPWPRAGSGEDGDHFEGAGLAPSASVFVRLR